MTTATRMVKPAVCKCKLLCKPIAPCEILPDGLAGSLEINGTLYEASIVGHLPKVGEPVVDGYRLTKINGESHDLCLVACRLECTCGDYEFRRSLRNEECKHCKAVRQLLPMPRDQYEPAVYAGDYTVKFEDL